MTGKPDCDIMTDPRGEFLAMVLHELKNPLSAIQLGVEVLRFADRDRQHPDWILGSIETSVAKLNKLTEDLLQLGQTMRPTFALCSKTMDLVATVQMTACRRRRAFDEKNLRLELQLPPIQLWIIGDVERLELAVGNLLDNAIKYTPTDGKIVVSVAIEDANALVRVRDSGVGISPEFLPFVFDPFARARNSLTSSVQGSGIGLLLVRTLIELHGGTVEAFSEGGGHGSEFIIRLPVDDLAGTYSVERATPELDRRFNNNSDGLAQAQALLRRARSHRPEQYQDARL